MAVRSFIVIRLEEMYEEFVKSLESMTYEEIMQSIEQARKDSEDSEIFDSDYYGLESEEQVVKIANQNCTKNGISNGISRT